MGAEPWSYFVPYQDNVEAALQALREQEFLAGRFNGSDMNPATMAEALEMTSPDGTRSILDMMGVSETPEFFAVAPLPPEKLREFFGTEQPTHAMVKANPDYFDDIERGQGIYVVVYKDGKPDELYFAGYSFD
jgi:hypothetical protein